MHFEIYYAHTHTHTHGLCTQAICSSESLWKKHQWMDGERDGQTDIDRFSVLYFVNKGCLAVTANVCDSTGWAKKPDCFLKV